MPRRPFRNAEGRLYKHLDIKLIIGDDVKKKRHTAAPGKGFTLENIREACDAMIEQLEKHFPKLEFREVCIAPNAYNYIANEVKDGKHSDGNNRQPGEESTPTE